MVKQVIPEILAPAGSMESLYAALHAKADAIYFGGKILSARAYAGNFGKEEIIEAVALAHSHQAKVYFTINTLVKNHELKLLEEIGDTIAYAGVDGVIIQDMGTYLFFRQYYPELALHASTQMTVHSIEGARRLHELGFERVVLSRELNLKEVKEIMKAVPIEVETFVHGAMCYCYSGQCQMSAAFGERSANRGRCAQPCRLPYIAGNKQGYLLSLKDQMTLEHLPELVKAGIHSLKIEGRMKNPEYVYTVASMYRKYRDLAMENRGYQVDKEDVNRMQQVFFRGQTSSGYYFVRKSGNMIFPEQPKTSKLTDPKTLSELSFVRNKPEQKTKIQLFLEAKKNQPLRLTVAPVDRPELTLVLSGGEVAVAEKKAVTSEDIKKPLLQVGETSFEVADIEVIAEEDIFVPMGKLKEIRRNALQELEQMLRQEEKKALAHKKSSTITRSRNIVLPQPFAKKRRYSKDEQKISVLVRTGEQFQEALSSAADILYLEWSFLSIDTILQILSSASLKQLQNKKIALAVPPILRNDEWHLFWKDLSRFKEWMLTANLSACILVRCADYLDVFKNAGFELYMDYSMNIWNQLSYQFYQSKYQPELIALGNEISYGSRAQLGSFELTVYGKLATMHTANCLSNVNSTFPNKQANEMCRIGAVETLNYITDRKESKIGYHRNCKNCSNTLYNPVPLFLADQDISFASCIRFELLDEEKEERAAIYKIMKDLKEAKAVDNPFSDFTRGHYSKGVE